MKKPNDNKDPVKTIEGLKVGDKVVIIDKGNTSADGSGDVCFNVGWIKTIKISLIDKEYPLLLCKNDKVCGYYKVNAVNKVK